MADMTATGSADWQWNNNTNATNTYWPYYPGAVWPSVTMPTTKYTLTWTPPLTKEEMRAVLREELQALFPERFPPVEEEAEEQGEEDAGGQAEEDTLSLSPDGEEKS